MAPLQVAVASQGKPGWVAAKLPGRKLQLHPTIQPRNTLACLAFSHHGSLIFPVVACPSCVLSCNMYAYLPCFLDFTWYSIGTILYNTIQYSMVGTTTYIHATSTSHCILLSFIQCACARKLDVGGIIMTKKGPIVVAASS